MVGLEWAGSSPGPFSARLTGTTWKKVTVSAPSNAQLSAVTFAPGGTAWGAVWDYGVTWQRRWDPRDRKTPAAVAATPAVLLCQSCPSMMTRSEPPSSRCTA